MMYKSNKIIGICSIIWGVLFFLFEMFFPSSVVDLIGMQGYMNASREVIEQYKEGLEAMNAIINVVFLICLIILAIFSIINCRKKGIKIFKNTRLSNGVQGIAGGAVLQILGLVGVSFLFVIAGGVFTLLSKE